MDVITLTVAKNGAKEYTDNAISSIGSGFTYKGSVATVSDLPASGNEKGDEYNVQTGGTYAWNGTAWYPVVLNGEKGDTGETGAQGPTGPAGPSGRIYDVTVNGTSVYDSTDNAAKLEIINAVNNTSVNKPLSANMGKELQDQVNNLKNIGRFLAIWDSSTGLPLSNPATMPYTYKTGDYYRVGTVASGGTNYKPNGATYDGTASTTEETGTVGVGYVYYYDGTQWLAQSAGGGGTVQDVQINSVSIIDSGTGVANIPKASDSALGVIKAWQGTQARYDAITTKDADTYYFITE